MVSGVYRVEVGHGLNRAPSCSGGFVVGGEVSRVFLAWVGLAAQTESSARMLPRLTAAVPMEAKLRKLLADFGGGLLGESHPNPFSNDFGDAESVGQ
jgi:hypothetical protein